jgi:hypothetical protein
VTSKDAEPMTRKSFLSLTSGKTRELLVYPNTEVRYSNVSYVGQMMARDPENDAEEYRLSDAGVFEDRNGERWRMLTE